MISTWPLTEPLRTPGGNLGAIGIKVEGVQVPQFTKLFKWCHWDIRCYPALTCKWRSGLAQDQEYWSKKRGRYSLLGSTCFFCIEHVSSFTGFDCNFICNTDDSVCSVFSAMTQLVSYCVLLRLQSWLPITVSFSLVPYSTYAAWIQLGLRVCRCQGLINKYLEIRGNKRLRV